jgi:hypothetical protein
MVWLPPDDERIVGRFRTQELDELCDMLFHGNPLDRAQQRSPGKTNSGRKGRSDGDEESASGSVIYP